MNISFRPAVPADTDACARIIHAAFTGIARDHGFTPDIPSLEAGLGLASFLTSHPRVWGVVAELVPNGKALSRARELAELCLRAPEVTRRNTRVHFMRPLKERIVREVGYGLSLEGASAADLVKSMQAKSEPATQKE